MPNYTKLEEQLLGAAERELATLSRQPALGALDEAGIYRLITQLDAAQKAADATPKSDGRSAADLLAAALRRVHAERRKRGLKPQPGKAAGARAAKPAAKPAKPAPAARRVPASPARKPAGRAKAETRKNDLRTGSRLVTKRSAKAEAAEAAVPAPAPVVSDATPSVSVETPSRKKVAKDAARKAAAKTAKAAEKESRQLARKAAKDAEKAAKKAAKKAVKDADKAAKKAARKAEKAAKSGGADA